MHTRYSSFLPSAFRLFLGVSLGALLLMAFSDSTHASSLRGVAYGQNVGLIHMDYTTAIRPSADPQFDAPAYYVGPTKQFYIPASNPAFTGPGNPSQIAQFGIYPSDCSASGCLMHGNLWSDTIGWISIDGEQINQEISALIGLPPAQEDTPSDPYPSSLYPRVLSSGALVGLAWSQSSGWFQFSSNSTAGVTALPTAQNSTTWGAWVDLGASPDPTFGDFPLRGYSWSEKLGWIKFSIEPQDLVSFSFDSFSEWTGDTTPPVTPPTNPIGNPPLNAVWLSVGVNTGASVNPRTVVWQDFIGDPESGINLLQSNLQVALAPGNPAECALPNTPLLECGSGGCTTANLVMDTIGSLAGVARGFCEYYVTGTIQNGAGLTTTLAMPSPRHFYVRAGVPDAPLSQLRALNASAVADGVDSIQFAVELRDIANNPVLSIDCSTPNSPPGANPNYLYNGCPNRLVNVELFFDNPTVFDLIAPIPPSSPYLTPLIYGDNPATVSVSGLPLMDTATSFSALSLSNGDHTFVLASYAPTETLDPLSPNAPVTRFDFNVNQSNYRIEDDALPATRFDLITGDPDPASVTPAAVLNASVSNGVNPSPAVTFLPALYTANPVVTTAGVSDTLTIGTPAQLQFSLHNRGATSINAGGFSGGISIDQVVQYRSSSPLVALMETHRLFDVADSDNDKKFGWLDPNEPYGINTLFETYDGDTFSGLSLNASTSPFHDVYQRFHPGYDFKYDAFGTASPIQPEGFYTLSGLYNIPQDYPPLDVQANLNDPANYPAGELDRSDLTSLGLNPSSQLSKTIELTPEKLIPATLGDIALRVIQGVAYRFEDQPLFARFYQPPLVDGLIVSEVGFDATGSVSGSSRVSGRTFQTIGDASTVDLQESMRRSVTSLTAAIQPKSSCSVPVAPLAQLPTTLGTCVVKDADTGALIAYFEGDSSETLTLGTGGGLVLPNFPYTLIIRGGANLELADNVYYQLSDTNASFGIILVANQIGDGANVYLQPSVTNVAAILYAEGSVLSRDASGGLYYGAGAGDLQDLSNQLYWRGSIASRNTIGGAYTQQIPAGISCLSGIRLSLAPSVSILISCAVLPFKSIHLTLPIPLPHSLPTTDCLVGAAFVLRERVLALPVPRLETCLA
ncbi:hypothetical protein IPJ72_03260 [Candidatus Peregrinibacteria bacterium]|nr:MAG: hypothetical protein IPJ72_03260 [Candidatus Peregrinibacteria bacterium]